MAEPPRRRFRPTHLVLRLLWTGRLREKACAHRDQIRVVQTEVDICPDCVALGDSWIDLRMCMTCGYVGCCDKVKNQHARKHYLSTGHPIVRSIEGRQDWMWCYVDEALLSPWW